ncbi:hypothetical protein F5Y05DRAFT_376385 [Hypoxylon sp. FL0543]|nr:hypothetical protein F5Y05DRAFT_376385 [Hypoxylon sp. FL0543]
MKIRYHSINNSFSIHSNTTKHQSNLQKPSYNHIQLKSRFPRIKSSLLLHSHLHLSSRPITSAKMFNVKVIFFAVFAFLAVNVIAAGASVRFNCVGKWYMKGKDGKRTIKREPKNYQTEVSDTKVLDDFVEKFDSWSGGAYTCKKSRHGDNLYNIETNHVGANKNDATNQVSEMQRIINAHK